MMTVYLNSHQQGRFFSSDAGIPWRRCCPQHRRVQHQCGSDFVEIKWVTSVVNLCRKAPIMMEILILSSDDGDEDGKRQRSLGW